MWDQYRGVFGDREIIDGNLRVINLADNTVIVKGVGYGSLGLG